MGVHVEWWLGVQGFVRRVCWLDESRGAAAWMSTSADRAADSAAAVSTSSNKCAHDNMSS